MMYQKALSPPSGGDPLAKYNSPAASYHHHQTQQQQQYYDESQLQEDPDVNAHEAVAWNSLCDQFTLNLIKLELQLSETNDRTELIEEEAALRVFIYNSLLFGITSHSARLSSHFSDLMDNVRSLENNHNRLLHENQSHASQIAEYHAKLILEQRSQAETQAMTYQSKIENLRQDERDLRVRVESLRQETEESQNALDRRRNESLEERRVLENELQRLQSDVGNQKYMLDRLNAQVDNAKQRLRENERMIIERSSVMNIDSSAMRSSSNNNNSSARSPIPSSATPLPRNNNNNNNSSFNNGNGNTSFTYYPMPEPHPSASPDRHGDSIASGVSNIQAVRDNAIDATFMRLGKVTPVRVPPQFNTSPVPQSQSNQSQLNGLSSVASRMQSNPRETANERTPIASTYGRPGLGNNGTTPSARSINNNAGISNGSLFESTASTNSKTPVMMMNPNASSSNQPSQWQLRLMKLQGELKSLKSDLGVASPK